MVSESPPPCLNCQLITSDGQCIKAWPQNTDSGVVLKSIRIKEMKERVQGKDEDMVPAYHVWRYYSDKKCFTPKAVSTMEAMYGSVWQ